jgi:hypothetical protein
MQMIVMYYVINKATVVPADRHHTRAWETITARQLVNKLSAFYGTLRFITVFTTAGHW